MEDLEDKLNRYKIEDSKREFEFLKLKQKLETQKNLIPLIIVAIIELAGLIISVELYNAEMWSTLILILAYKLYFIKHLRREQNGIQVEFRKTLQIF